MRWARLGSVAVVLAAVGISLVPGARAAESATVESDEALTDRLHQLVIDSPALGRTAGVRVLLPTDFDDPANADRRWPILWLLHGVGDDSTTWTNNTDIEELTADLPLVVAMPEAGKSPEAGWYSDWVDGPAWETFHLRELLPLIESRYHAGGARERRVVAGLSMGGFGTMSYAARHPDYFLGAASFSGAVDTVIAGPVTSTTFALLHPYAGTPDDRVWGPYETSEITWRGHNPTDLASNLRPLALWVRTGNGVPQLDDPPNPASQALETGIYTMNTSFHQRLTGLGIEHAWFDRGYGLHTWRYWQEDLHTVLPELVALLADPPPRPERFDYRFVEDTADVWGWAFEITDRSGAAFTELVSVGDDGLTVWGAGTLTATTPTGYAGSWRVQAAGVDDVVAAGDDGRLTFTVPLDVSPVEISLTPVSTKPEAPTVQPDGQGRLPATGRDPVAPAAIVVGALVAGLLLRRVDRRASTSS